jgi:GNAT superfamily N-acetyltransferase
MTFATFTAAPAAPATARHLSVRAQIRGVEFDLLGWPADGPTLRLDHRRFSYAGKFVMSNTGKAVARVDGDVVAAVSFNEDRTDADAAWLRYVTVREDRRSEGIGPRLAAFATARLHERGYERVRIAVNNPFAYRALYRAGFAFADRETGIAELVLVHPGDRDPERYRDGLARFADREDLADDERAFLAEHRDGNPPDPIEAPT